MPWQRLRGESVCRTWSENLKRHGVVAPFVVASDAIAVHCHAWSLRPPTAERVRHRTVLAVGGRGHETKCSSSDGSAWNTDVWELGGIPRSTSRRTATTVATLSAVTASGRWSSSSASSHLHKFRFASASVISTAQLLRTKRSSKRLGIRNATAPAQKSQNNGIEISPKSGRSGGESRTKSALRSTSELRRADLSSGLNWSKPTKRGYRAGTLRAGFVIGCPRSRKWPRPLSCSADSWNLQSAHLERSQGFPKAWFGLVARSLGAPSPAIWDT